MNGQVRIPWATVRERVDRMLILASGPSLDIPTLRVLEDVPKVAILAINRSIQYCVRADFWFTLDPDERVWPVMLRRTRRQNTKFYAAVPEDYGSINPRVRYHSRPLLPHIYYLKRIAGSGVIGSKSELSPLPDRIHTGNSAWGALGLAYLMGAKRIGFLGLDASMAPYTHMAGAPRTRIDFLPDLFATAIPQLEAKGIEVRVGTPSSKVTCFPRCTPKQLAQWLQEGLEDGRATDEDVQGAVPVHLP